MQQDDFGPSLLPTKTHKHPLLRVPEEHVGKQKSRPGNHEVRKRLSFRFRAVWLSGGKL
jgi:hypothetical protein